MPCPTSQLDASRGNGFFDNLELTFSDIRSLHTAKQLFIEQLTQSNIKSLLGVVLSPMNFPKRKNADTF